MEGDPPGFPDFADTTAACVRLYGGEFGRNARKCATDETDFRQDAMFLWTSLPLPWGQHCARIAAKYAEYQRYRGLDACLNQTAYYQHQLGELPPVPPGY